MNESIQKVLREADEYINRINEFIGSYNPLDGFRQLQIKLILLYKYLEMYEMDK